MTWRERQLSVRNGMMFEKTRLLWSLYKRAIPRDPLRRRMFIVSQLILLTAVPLMTLFQLLGGYWLIIPFVYLFVLMVLAYSDTMKLHKEFYRQEQAMQVAEKLRE